MKKIKILVRIILMMLLAACSKDPAPVTPDPINRPPGSFGLIGVTDGATKIDLLPTFSWQAPTDPDGDAVTYDLLLETGADPKTVVASNLTGTTFTVSERLHLIADYHWKVVAKDGKGGTSQSSVFGFTTRNLHMPTAPVTTTGLTKGVFGHTTTLYVNDLYTIGGFDGGNYLYDVWESNDGAHWQQNLIAPGFSPRANHTTTEFHGELWVIGGLDGSKVINEVWHTGFGSDWVEATPAAPFSARSVHATVVFDNKLWVIGGRTAGNIALNDVWYSSDGNNWTQATAAAGFSSRYGHTAVVFDNKMWVIGGTNNSLNNFNDVWYSCDGITWVEATPKAAFAARSYHTTVVFDDKLWVIGGFIDSGLKNDIWYSGDGVNWASLLDKSPFTERAGHTTVVFGNRLWVIGGYDGTIQNDVWALD